MKKIVLLLVICIFANRSKAQTIQSVYVSPASPTSNDNITVNVDYLFTSGACDLVNQNFTMIGNGIYTYHFHCPGMLTVICTGTDQLPIGTLSAGNYTVYASLFTGTYDSLGLCSQFSQTDLVNFNFVVSLGTGVDQITKSKPIVFMNKEMIKVSNVTSAFQFKLFDIAGKEIVSQTINGNESTINVSVESGTYFYSMLKDGLQVYTGKLISE